MIAALVLAAVTGLVPLAAGPAAAAPATVPEARLGTTLVAASGGACSGATGVTVVVDFGSHGGTAVRCAGGDPGSASKALDVAGFSQVRVQKQPAFLCRIDGVPGAKQDACMVTPPATAYWSLWTAPRGGPWTFANVGVDLLDPKPGSVVGFAFGAGHAPEIAAPAAQAARPTATRAAGTSATGPSPAKTTSPSRVEAGGATATVPTPAASSTSAPASAAAAPTPAASPAAGSAASTLAGSPPSASAASLSATPAAAHPDDGTGSVGTWVGVGAVVAVSAAAWARTRRRHR